jgi:hypothetical protein
MIRRSAAMTVFSPLTQRPSIGLRRERLVIASARLWRLAREQRMPAGPSLHRLLEPRGLPMLAPGIDSMLRLAERASGRAFGLGTVGPHTPDETRLLALLAAPDTARQYLAGGEGIAQTFRCALLSVRLLLRRA